MEFNPSNPRFLTFWLRQLGWPQARIAKEIGISKGSVSYAINTGSSELVADFVCRIVGKEKWELWPYRFQPPSHCSEAPGASNGPSMKLDQEPHDQGC